MSEAAANKLESWYAGLPGIVQSTLHEPYRWMDDALRSISGDPDALRAAAEQYPQFAQIVRQVAAQQLQDRAALNGHWKGESNEAFTLSVDFVDQQMQRLEAALKGVPEVLEAGAQACVEGANMIIDIVTSLIMFAIGILVTNAALALLTAGISIAAGVAEVLASAANALARVAGVVEKVSAVLKKIAAILDKVTRLLKKITEVLQKLDKALTAEKKTAKASQGMEKVKAQAIFTGKNVAVSKAISGLTGGYDNPPGGVGELKDGAVDYYRGWQHAGDARDAANTP